MKKSNKLICLFIFLFLFVPNTVNAAFASVSISGNGSANTDSNFELNIAVNNSGTEKTMTMGGTINISNPSCVSIVDIVGVASGVDTEGNMISFFKTSGISGNFTIAKIKLKAASTACSTAITITDGTLSSVSGIEEDLPVITKNVTITTVPSTPSKSNIATLKSLVPSKGTLKPTFSSNTETYSMDVDNSVTSITFTAAVTDTGKANVSGTSCNLNVGSNTCKIVVTAEDGTKKTYTVKVTRASAQNSQNNNKPQDNTPTNDNKPTNNDKPDNTSTNDKPSNTDKPTNNENSNNTGSNNNSGSTNNNTGSSSNNTGNSNNSGNTNSNTQNKKSSDNDLKSLVVSNGKLSPSFSAKTLYYTMNVDLDVSKLEIEAKANDDKAKVTINNPELKENAKTNVTIKVTAENGNTKTYTISVIRGTLPEKPLNEDNTLSSLTPSVGILSPKFDANKSNYYIYVPYEIEEIDFDYNLSDSKTATAQLIGNKNLQPNSKNEFQIIVKAENDSERTYTITVYRAINPEFMNNSSVKIKSLDIGKANIEGSFDSDKTHYYYNGKLDLDNIVLIDENSTYQIINANEVTYIVVEAPNGDVGIYCFHNKKPDKKKSNILIVVLSITTSMGVIGSGYLLFDKYYLAKKVITKKR